MSKFADRRPDASLAKLVSFNRGDVSDRSPGSWAQTGTLVGNAAVSNGVLVLDGTGDYLTYPDATHLDMPSAFSVSFWFEPSTPGSGSKTFCAKERTTGNQRSFYFLADYTSNRYDVAMCSDGAVRGAANSVAYYFAATLPTTGWHHFGCVYDGSAGNGLRFKLWINGVSVSASTLVRDAAGLTPFNCNRELQIGAYDGGFAWKGNMDDFRLYRRALTAAEVGGIYSSGRQ